MALLDVCDKPVWVTDDAPLSKGISALRQSGTGVLVTGAGGLRGVIDSRTLLRFDGDATQAKCGTLARKCPSLDANDPAERVVQQFLETDVTLLPVLSKGKVAGVLTRASALRLLENARPLRETRVRDVASPLRTIPASASVAQARKYMLDNGAYRLLVLDAKSRPAGVLSAFDVVTKTAGAAHQSFRESNFSIAPHKTLADVPVQAAFTPDVASIDANAPLSEAAKKMASGERRSLVALSAGKPLGFVSSRDVFHALMAPAPLNVVIQGLREDERSLRESLLEHASQWLEKFGRRIDLSPEDALVLHVKSTPEGFKRRYEVKARLTVQGRTHAIREQKTGRHRSMWDAGMALREALDELERAVAHAEGRRPSYARREDVQAHYAPDDEGLRAEQPRPPRRARPKKVRANK